MLRLAALLLTVAFPLAIAAVVLHLVTLAA